MQAEAHRTGNRTPDAGGMRGVFGERVVGVQKELCSRVRQNAGRSVDRPHSGECGYDKYLCALT